MTKTGIVFAFLVVLLSGFAMYETAKFVTIRNAWMEKVETAEKSANQNVEEVAKQELLENTLLDELSRQQLGWGQFWSAQTNLLDAGTGRLQVDLGTNQGLSGGADGSQLPTLYAFRPVDGGMEYAGAFKVTTLNANQAAMQLVDAPRPNEVQSWGLAGGAQNWRFRTQIPGGISQFSDYNTQFVVADEKLQERLNNIDLQTKFAEKAEEQLQQRLAELNGDPNALNGLGDVFKLGLVESIQKEDMERNEALVRLGQLREELDQKWKQFEALKAENAALAGKLPGANGSTPQTSSTANSSDDEIQ